MRLSNNIHNVCELEGSQLVQEYKEEEKIAIKKPAPPKPKEEPKKEAEAPAEPPKEGEAAADAKPAEGEKKAEEPPKEPEAPKQPETEQDFEIKIRERKTYRDVKFSTSSFALTPAVKRTFTDFEQSLYDKDFEILALKAIKNDLEAYAYKMRDICGSYGSHEKYIDPAVKDDFLAKVGQVVDWIYGEGENATMKEYQEKLN